MFIRFLMLATLGIVFSYPSASAAENSNNHSNNSSQGSGSNDNKKDEKDKSADREEQSPEETAQKEFETKMGNELKDLKRVGDFSDGLNAYFEGMRTLGKEPSVAEFIGMVTKANPGATMWFMPNSESGQPGQRLVVGLNNNQIMFSVSLESKAGQKTGNNIEMFQIIGGVKAGDIGKPGKTGFPGQIDFAKAEEKSESSLLKASDILLKSATACLGCHSPGANPGANAQPVTSTFNLEGVSTQLTSIPLIRFGADGSSVVSNVPEVAPFTLRSPTNFNEPLHNVPSAWETQSEANVRFWKQLPANLSDEAQSIINAALGM